MAARPALTILATLTSLTLPASASAQVFETAYTFLVTTAEQVVSTVKVETKQYSASSGQTSTASTSSAKAAANVLVESDTNAAINRALVEYEASYNSEVAGACAAIAVGQASESGATTADDMNEVLAEHEQNWMSVGGSRADTQMKGLQMRREYFCSEGEADLGLCAEGAEDTYGAVAAADSSAEPWLIRREYGTYEVQMGTLFMDTVAPLPTIASASEAEGNVPLLVERAAARRQAALVSIARGALGDVITSGVQGGLE
mgnify:CR=1 FL=1|tara:strand:+ start:7888 stop:8667 length:780 start_codon:yes stop_codon:yes gene_type:complete